ncbi:MAG: class I SAM-dependent methyltransferase [Myxococcota bacterium]
MNQVQFDRSWPLTRLWAHRGLTWHVELDGQLNINGVKGFLLPGDVETLLKLGKHIPPGGVVVEVGSWMGLSTILIVNGLLLNMNFDARVHAVDTWRGSKEHQDFAIVKDDQLFSTFEANIAGAGVASWITPHRVDSVSAASAFEDGSIDAIFIDGDHSEAGCLADLRAYYPKLKASGIFFGHDAAPNSGVTRALDRFTAETGRRFQISPPPEGHYIWTMLAEEAQGG